MDGAASFPCIDLGVGGAEAPTSASLVQQCVGQLGDLTGFPGLCRPWGPLKAPTPNYPLLHPEVRYKWSYRSL